MAQEWQLIRLFAAILFALPLLGGAARAEDTRSIRHWVSCDGTRDDWRGAAAAFAAASGGRFTLLVDCPVFIHTGMDVARPIFVESGTDIEFGSDGKFILDNELIPAFAIIDSRDVTFHGWQVVYTGGLPVDANTGFYVDNGRNVPSAGHDPPAAMFLRREAAWLTARRGVSFTGVAQPPWHGPANTSALFYIDGDTENLTVTAMDLRVPAGAGADRFIPVAFSMTYGAKPGVLMFPGMAVTPVAFAVPRHLRFEDMTIDGAYMGWQGSAQDLTIRHVRAYRYGDLQNAAGGQVGGASLADGKIIHWFAPPHLFYINNQSLVDPALDSRDIHISDVIDYGVRVGVARDTAGDCCSGNALSLKIGAIDSDVTGYQSDRADGFLDVLDSDHLMISDVTARYDSAFLNNLYPGIRFPGKSYHDVTLRNVTLTDQAAVTVKAPVVASRAAAQSGTVLRDVTIILNAWAGGHLMPYGFPGTGDDISVTYRIGPSGKVVTYQQTSGLLNGSAPP
jgi:hypothetical protein